MAKPCRASIVCDSEIVVIVGDTRLLAAHALKLPEVPEHVANGLMPAQVQAYRIADNRPGQKSMGSDSIDLPTIRRKGL